MKTLLRMILAGSLLLTIHLSGTLAQSGPTMAEQIEHLFGQLDFTEVASNVLYDYGMDFYNWRLMHGKQPNDSVIITSDQWGYLCFQASSSGVNDFDPVPDSGPYFAWAYKLPSDPDTVALGVLHLDYHYIREDAVTEGLLAWNATDTLHITDGYFHVNFRF